MEATAGGHVFIATSLDGFIARPDGAIDWLDRPGTDEDHGYAAFLSRMDGLLMGRATCETVRGFDIPWPYEKPVVVLSRSLTEAELPPDLAGRVRIWDASPRAALARLHAEGWARAYVDGGALIRSCLESGLIDEITLTRLPVLIGEGRPLFGPLPADVALIHLGTRSFASGLVQSRYALPRTETP